MKTKTFKRHNIEKKTVLFHLFQRLTSFGGPQASGETISTILTGMFRCCILHEGTRGVETGVSPVPPPISESKLNVIPVEGVEIGIPMTSQTVLGIEATTFSEFGRLGLHIGTVELNMTLFVGEGRRKISWVMGSINSVFTRSSSSLSSYKLLLNGFTSGGLCV